MLVAVVFLLDNQICKQINRIKQDIAAHFEVTEAVKRGTPPHLTLKYAFDVKQIDEVVKILSDLVSHLRPCKLSPAGIDSFESPPVVFLEVNADDMMKQQHQLLLNALKVLPIHFKQVDKVPDTYHVTLAKKDIRDRIKEVKEFAEGLFLPTQAMTFNNIALLGFEDKKWKILKEFKFA